MRRVLWRPRCPGKNGPAGQDEEERARTRRRGPGRGGEGQGEERGEDEDKEASLGRRLGKRADTSKRIVESVYMKTEGGEGLGLGREAWSTECVGGWEDYG